MTRGNNVFSKLQYVPPESGPPLAVRDLFLHTLFARIALNDESTVEFSTYYDPLSNEIELDIPAKLLPLLDQIVGMQRGDNFKTFINWLIGSESINQGIIETQVYGGINISVQREIFEYTYVGSDNTVTTRVKIQNTSTDATYTIEFYINNIQVMPSSVISITGGSGTIIFQSKMVYVETNDVITVKITGDMADTDVDTEVILSY